MDQTKKIRMEARAQVLKALAHPARLIIVDELSAKKCCVADLTRAVEADMSTVSRHLGVLKAAGLVSAEKKGTQVFYCLNAPCVLDFFACVESVLKSNLQAQIEITSPLRSANERKI